MNFYYQNESEKVKNWSCYEEAKFLIYCLNIRKCLEGGRTAESLINDYEVQYGQLNLTHKLRVVRRVNKFITLLILDVFFCFFIIGKLRHTLLFQYYVY